jgi:hypothetical protein
LNFFFVYIFLHLFQCFEILLLGWPIFSFNGVKGGPFQFSPCTFYGWVEHPKSNCWICPCLYLYLDHRWNTLQTWNHFSTSQHVISTRTAANSHRTLPGTRWNLPPHIGIERHCQGKAGHGWGKAREAEKGGAVALFFFEQQWH